MSFVVAGEPVGIIYCSPYTRTMVREFARRLLVLMFSGEERYDAISLALVESGIGVRCGCRGLHDEMCDEGIATIADRVSSWISTDARVANAIADGMAPVLARSLLQVRRTHLTQDELRDGLQCEARATVANYGRCAQRYIHLAQCVECGQHAMSASTSIVKVY